MMTEKTYPAEEWSPSNGKKPRVKANAEKPIAPDEFSHPWSLAEIPMQIQGRMGA
jgi:hypothetical protein